MTRRLEIALAGGLAGLLGANAAFMLAAPFSWYEAVPGVVKTGPFNQHFVRDIGAAYLICAIVLAAFVWRPARVWPALLAAAGFLALHALIHLFDVVCGRSSPMALVQDLPGVFLPAILVAGLGLRAALREA